MTNYLRELGHVVNPKRIRRLYRLMDLHAIGPRPNTSRPHKGKGHTVYSYLLRNLEITLLNQVWAMDITYLPLAGGGWMYLVAIIDLYSRYIVGWSLSNTMISEWCKACLQAAIAVHGEPEIINTDQESKFTSHVFTSLFNDIDSKLSMDGKGRAIDNIWIERFWKSIKYNYIYISPSDNGLELFEEVRTYIEYYNQKKHQTTKKETQ